MFKKIVNAGITAETPFNDITRLRGMNYGSLIAIGLSLVSASLAYDAPVLMWLLLLLVVFLSTGILLNYVRKTKIARCFVVISIFLWLVTASISFGSRLGLENYFFVALVGILIFETNDRLKLIYSSMITLALVGVKIYQVNYPPLFEPPVLANLFYFNNALFPCLIIAVLCLSMVKNVREYQSGILQRKQSLYDANEFKDKMLSIIGHDLRSPMNNLKGVLCLANEGVLSQEEQQQLLRELEERLDHATETLDSLLSWASHNYFDRGHASRTLPAPLNMHEQTQRILDFYVHTAQQKRVIIANRIPMHTMVYAHKDQLQFVLRNLIGNALKFSRTDGSAFVFVSADTVHGMVEISVSDNGMGMDNERMKHLFDIDNRSSESGTLNEPGSGFGLIFCKEFIEHNGGTLSVESTPGKGSMFRFSLPCVPD